MQYTCDTMNPPRIAIVLLLYAPIGATVAAQTPGIDKSGYSILDPTPRDCWRPMSADRPDFTESPYTVDAGAVQLEMSFFDWARDGGNDAYALAPFNLKIGLLNDVDLQLILVPYRYEDAAGGGSNDGFGETQVRLKINFWGNDGGTTAFGFMPFITAPTASDDLGSDNVQGGLIFPFAMDIAEGVGLGLMFETDFVHDAADDAYDTEFITTAVVGFDLTDELGAYVEGIGIASTDPDQDYRALLGLGVTYGISENVVLDIGVNVGLTSAADDVNVLSGITVRF